VFQNANGNANIMSTLQNNEHFVIRLHFHNHPLMKTENPNDKEELLLFIPIIIQPLRNFYQKLPLSVVEN